MTIHELVDTIEPGREQTFDDQRAVALIVLAAAVLKIAEAVNRAVDEGIYND